MQEEEQNQETKLPSIVEWFFHKKKQVVYSVGLAFFLGFLIYEYSPFFKQKDLAIDKTYKAYAEWKSHSEDLSLADDLREQISKNPTLKPNYQGVLLQHLLDQNQEVRKDALDALSRTEDLSNWYGEFAKITLTINEKQYEKALEDTLALQETLSENTPNSLLRAHNMLRIASLYKQMDMKSKELAAWDDVESLLLGWRDHPETNKIYQRFAQGFSNKESIAFEDFIADRKKAL